MNVYLVKKPAMLLFVLLFFSYSHTHANTEIKMSKSIMQNNQLSFETHHGSGAFDTALAMNVYNAPVNSVRDQVSKYLGLQLKFFTGWNQNGEAHVTVITPPEYFYLIKPYLNIDEIDEIAQQSEIQNSGIDIIGIGSGESIIDGKKEQTYFLIVISEALVQIRHKIYDEYLRKGGPKDAWDPDHFYPHITIGYTLRDLHETDGVIKDASHSIDSRFELTFIE